MSHRDERADQLTTAPKADESDADPRIEVSEGAEGRRRIDVRDDAEVRPGAEPGHR
ncbi:multidrug transporter [Leifsonia sp. 21MFCrub1.1]|uniref:multidrug transporter n=1 Tax=Leifsonia sp. 21MFCrub1.1 TaxID=1798223 RepID=UPI0008929551|nr:multidrug transporter [Leifsonia sp. 21MFCrub1.1]SEA93902.1 hypothetical protein SAMN04515680_2221 [Leifsonia sp. 21MFCrub1.1]